MPYAIQYKKFIDKEVKTSKSKLKPRKIYRITSYTYADGEQKVMAGINTSYIFATGIYHKKLYGIKLTLIRPDTFFKWLKTIMLKNLKESDFIDAKLLSNYLIYGEKTGTKIFNSYVKGNSIYKKDPSAFRTYNVDGIKQISEVVLKTDKLAEIYGIKLHKDAKEEKEEAIKDSKTPKVESEQPIKSDLPIRPQPKA